VAAPQTRWRTRASRAGATRTCRASFSLRLTNPLDRIDIRWREPEFGRSIRRIGPSPAAGAFRDQHNIGWQPNSSVGRGSFAVRTSIASKVRSRI